MHFRRKVMMHHYGLMGMGWGTWIFWIAILAFILIAAIAAGRRASRPYHEGRTALSALEILRERYARGEIGTEEYRDRRSVLEGG
ncbi:MAG: SHOCT domain-containing protein [bacterium]